MSARMRDPVYDCDVVLCEDEYYDDEYRLQLHQCIDTTLCVALGRRTLSSMESQIVLNIVDGHRSSLILWSSGDSLSS